MSIKLSRETLLKPLQMAAGVVERRQTLPILSNVLVSIGDQKITMTGTDLEVELVGMCELDSDVQKSLTTTLPGKKLMDICKALPENAAIELVEEADRIILKSGRSRFSLATLSPAEFPNVENIDSTMQFSIPQNQLLKLLQRTAFSMAQQDVRYYLNGMLLEIQDGNIRTVATDGHRLALYTLSAPVINNDILQVIIPRKAVMELMRLLQDADDEVDLLIGKNHIQVVGPNFTFTSKLIEGKFPDYDRVLPKDGDKEIVLDRNTLKQSLARISILSNEKFRGVHLQLRNGLLRLLANNPEQEEAEEEVAVEYEKEDIDIGFNVNYLIDILSSLATNTVKLVFSGPDSSILIEEPENNDDNTYVIMPMRL